MSQISMFTFSVLINNHNYAKYVVEAVNSALFQTHKVLEVIVVDDGSTDESVDLLKQAFGNNARVRLISQKNQGQLAAMATGIAAASGDIICLMDSDDRFHPNYIEELAKTYLENPLVDVVFCSYDIIGDNPISLSPSASVWLQPECDYDYGYSALLTYFGGTGWIGNVTSCVSIKTRLARMLDLQDAGKNWNYQTEADYVLLLGASILGGRKYYLHKPLVDYRVHGGNCLWVLKPENDKKHGYRRKMLYDIALNYFRKKVHLSDDAHRLLNLELETVPAPMKNHVRAYKRLCKKWGLVNRVRMARDRVRRQL